MDSPALNSLSSLFVPVESQNALQVINEAKEFNSNILGYINRVTPAQVGDNYHIVSVFGSQLTGKLTLLNQLFHTNFDVMDDARGRSQTTKGIWMAYSPAVTASHQTKGLDHIFVMDVEGTDGRERGEDQDFERKAALFALSTSEILIVNIWEHQVGLYQGANMGLLKTVFEVNLLLFGKAKLDHLSDHKVLLLFVIRDHVGNTPLQLLAELLRVDLLKMWDGLNKPAELVDLSFDDFFDVDFHAIHHKILQPEEFKQDVAHLGDRLTGSPSLFKKNYHHDIPVDGWTMYAENCWEQIETNKDLDLPTQQILVAKFKCDEIANSAFSVFSEKFDEIVTANQPSDDFDLDNLAQYMQDMKDEVLAEYDEDALRYNPQVYQQRRQLLADRIHIKFQSLFDAHVSHAIKRYLDEFASNLKALKGKDFAVQLRSLNTTLDGHFELLVVLLGLGGAMETEHLRKDLQQQTDAIIKSQQALELTALVNKATKRLGNAIGRTMEQELFEGDHEDSDAWDIIAGEFNRLVEAFLAKYSHGEGYEFGLATTPLQNADAVARFKFKAWDTWYQQTRQLITKESVLGVLKDRFESQFRYDEDGKPRLYQNTAQLEVAFDKAKEYSLAALPVVSRARLSDGTDIVPQVDIFDSSVRAKYGQLSLDDELDSEQDVLFSLILDDRDQLTVLAKYKKEIDAQFIETKRLIIQHITQIPYYIYLVILFLGWNEFMAVLRNPFLFSLLLIFAAGVYALYTMNMLSPAIAVGQRMADEAVKMAKEKLKEMLLEDNVTVARHLEKTGGKPAKHTRPEIHQEEEAEEIELQEL